MFIIIHLRIQETFLSLLCARGSSENITLNETKYILKVPCRACLCILVSPSVQSSVVLVLTIDDRPRILSSALNCTLSFSPVYVNAYLFS